MSEDMTESGGEIVRETPLACEEARVLSIDAEQRRVTHVISTGRLDRGNRIVDVSGWRLSNFKRAPRVLANHDASIERIIGRAIDTKVEGDALISTTEFDSEGLGAVAFRLVQNGLVNTWSVGWMGIKQHRIGSLDDCPACSAAAAKKVEWGTHFTQQELLEYSLVALPANPDVVMGLRAAGLVSSQSADEWRSTFYELPTRSAPFYDRLHDLARSASRRTAAMKLRKQLSRLH